MSPEAGEKLEKLSREKLMELVHFSMDIKVEGLAKLFKSGLSSNEQEQ